MDSRATRAILAGANLPGTTRSQRRSIRRAARAERAVPLPPEWGPDPVYGPPIDWTCEPPRPNCMRVETAPYLLFPVFCRGAGRLAGRSIDRSAMTRTGAVEVVEWLWANRDRLGAAGALAGTSGPAQTVAALWDEFEAYHRLRHGSIFDFDATAGVVQDVVAGTLGRLGAPSQGAPIDWDELAWNQKHASTVLLPAFCAGVGKRAGYAQWEYGWLYWGGTGLVDLLWWHRNQLSPPGPPSVLDFSKLDDRGRVLTWTRWMLQRLFPHAVGLRWSSIVDYLDRVAEALPVQTVPVPPRVRSPH